MIEPIGCIWLVLRFSNHQSVYQSAQTVKAVNLCVDIFLQIIRILDGKDLKQKQVHSIHV